MKVTSRIAKRRRQFHLPSPDEILRARRGVEKAAKAVFDIERAYGYRAWKSSYDPMFPFKEPELLSGVLASMRDAQDKLTDLFRLEAARVEDRQRRESMERMAAQLLHAENVRVMPRAKAE